MRRTSFTLAAALSAVLCATAAGFWVETRHGNAWAGRWGNDTEAVVVDGRAVVTRAGVRPGPDGWYRLRTEFSPTIRTWRPGPGVVYEANDPAADDGYYHRSLTVPLWAATAAASVLPAAWFFAWGRHRRRLRRAAGGLCAACGYDLRATPRAGEALLSRCPECGAVPAARTGRYESGGPQGG